ncbi:L-seryl-tRNA(Sec) selenium transferase [Beijerinckia sp. L45]|uniref:L-seryl-tRNA(Sec) selenium transferase n=1 Tax=Beijerinckia sp. L45 TaxID=1641855 RepID=UPI00131B2FF4|nr:L-seryl-tRNA(Sec) selenium transferase [Beijerinckia sp. L45]
MAASSKPAAQPGATGRLPSVDRLLAHPDVIALIERFGRAATLDALRTVLAAARQQLQETQAEPPSDVILAARTEGALAVLFKPSLKAVFNLTGTVLHTNLGRALLTPEAAQAVAHVLTQASNLEFDLATGKRGDRDSHIEALICGLTGAEAATIVNNNAAAVLLVLTALAAKKEVLVSRGELVEIGGAFRIPDVMARAGCKLKEVGTTNRTHLRDYAENIGARTAAVMKIHQSNYEIRGFTAEVAASDLGALCRDRGVPFLDDLGSGNLVDLSTYGLAKEPTVGEALRHADVVTFSGDKLLGGVQCGIIAGRKDLIAKIRKNALKRALRVDKMTIAAMETILRLYLDPARLAQTLPTLRMITRPEADVRAQAERLAPAVALALSGQATVAVVACASQIGSGALPVETLPSAALALTPAGPGRGAGRWLNAFADRLRALPMPVIGRVSDAALLLDLRTLEDEAAFLHQMALLTKTTFSAP